MDISFSLLAFILRSFNASLASSLFSLISSVPVTIETVEIVEDDDAIEVVRENKGPERLSRVIFRFIEPPGAFRWRLGETEPPTLEPREKGARTLESLLEIEGRLLENVVEVFFFTCSGSAL